jgi:hypothetical protein
MTDFTKGGRGKKAPYKTEMYRIPSAIKETVQQLAMAYKRMCDNGSPINPSSHLQASVQSVISAIAYDHKLIVEHDDDGKNPIEEEHHHHHHGTDTQLEAVRELVGKWKGNSRDTRNWVEANRLLKELEMVLLPKNE